jgi:hypothetical protein
LLFVPPPKGVAPEIAGRGVSMIYLHLALVLIIGFAMPPLLVRLLSDVSTVLQ